MIHHNLYHYNQTIVHYSFKKRISGRYGVSPALRVLSPQTMWRRHDLVVRFLRDAIDLTTGQREVVLRLLQFWCHYGLVYPKENQVTENPGCSKATYWRTVKLLQAAGLLTIVNRYVHREKAQISNLYLLDKLVTAIAKFLSEHGQRFYQKWLAPVFGLPWPDFWASLTPGALAPP